MSSFRDKQIADQFVGSVMKCRTCRSLTAHETLCSLGGMCDACYAHYCDPRPRGPALTLEQKRAILERARGLFSGGANPGRQCADALRARRARDGKPGSAQRIQLAALEAAGK